MACTNLMIEENIPFILGVIKEGDSHIPTEIGKIGEIANKAKYYYDKRDYLMACVLTVIVVIYFFRTEIFNYFRTNQVSCNIIKAVDFLHEIFKITTSHKLKNAITKLIENILLEVSAKVSTNNRYIDLVNISVILSNCQSRTDIYKALGTCETYVQIAKEKIKNYKLIYKVACLLHNYGDLLRVIGQQDSLTLPEKQHIKIKSLKIYTDALEVYVNAVDCFNEDRKASIKHTTEKIQKVSQNLRQILT